MNKYIFLIIIIFIAFIIIIGSRKETENFINYGGASVEFFYAKGCSLCPLAKEKLSKKTTNIIERNVTLVKRKKTVCQNNGVCNEIEYEEYENMSDGQRGASLSITRDNVPAVVMTSNNIVVIMYINEQNIHRL